MSPADTLTVRQFFSRKGLLARCHPAYEFRAGQLEMAEAVEAALAERRHLIAEALGRNANVLRRAARELGADPVTLGRRARRYGLLAA